MTMMGTRTTSESRAAPLVIKGRHKPDLQIARDLIDDIDGVAFGKLPDLLNDLAVLTDRALSERDEWLDVLKAVSAQSDKLDPKIADLVYDTIAKATGAA